MAYNEKSAERIRQIFFYKNVEFTEKKMFSGICFMVDNKMCCGTHIDNKTEEDYLLCRINPEIYEACLSRDQVIPMTFTGKPMKGFVFVLSSGVDTKKKLSEWIQLCLDFNPLAKKS